MEVSSVKLRNSYQAYYVDSNHIFLKNNSLCIVETEHGIDMGNVCKCPRFQNTPHSDVKGKILREANNEDLEMIPEIEAIEEKAYRICKEKAVGKKLNLKLVSVKCLFDKTKIIFYFVADNRVDFRELVRELASVFRTRIEMRQIGVRDEAKLVGGFGACGKEHCCVHQRDDFDPVSIKMAKEQNLNLNSMKISGMCGRLLCCLGYEFESYKDLNDKLPRPGTEIKAENKIYYVTSINLLDESLQIKDRESERTVKISKYNLVYKNHEYSIKKEVLDRIMSDEDSS
ncbi:stage 0 sporulation family protein [Spirochaetota bacterium]